MLGRDSENEMWSRLVFELGIWPKQVTLVSWTQPLDPLCLWQCFQKERPLECKMFDKYDE